MNYMAVHPNFDEKLSSELDSVAVVCSKLITIAKSLDSMIDGVSGLPQRLNEILN